MKVFQPTASYEISLPDDVVEEHDGRVTSYWRTGHSLLLQFSSTSRILGEQVTADDRLQDLYRRSPAEWSPCKISLQNFSGHCAAAQMRDKKGVAWIHAYLVTDRLAIHVTVSSPLTELETADNWAIEAVRTLRVPPPVVN